MQTVGATAANIGGKAGLKLEKNAMQLQIEDINQLQAQLPPDAERLAM